TRCLRFAGWVTPPRRKTRFQPLVRRYWTGSLPQGSNGRFQSASLHLILLPQALLGAITSSVAAQARATTPSGALCMRPAVKMRASTGKAVTDRATPRNRAKLVNGTSLVESRG